ncbi:MAG: HEAT repeat domain-containing protein [Desulfovibrionaceae bacterium]|nr:HEAT repeat domain-containing protein [Desulfovibrionaceae bacterium]
MDTEKTQVSAEEILNQLRSDSSATIREAAFIAGDNAIQEAIPDLCKLVQNTNIGIQEAAEYALRKIRGQQVIENLLPVLQSEEASVRNVAMDILREIGVDSIESMRPYLKGEDADIRIFIADILGHCQSHKSADLLAESLLRDPEVNVRYQAAVSLGTLACPESVLPLSRAMHDEEWVQFAVVEALAKIKDTSASTALVQLLPQTSPLVASAIVDALGDLGDIKILPMLLNALENVNEALRNTIVKTVVRILNGTALTLLPNKYKNNLNIYLLSALADDDEDIQAAALTGIKAIGTEKSSLPVLKFAAATNPESDPERYDQAIDTLSALGFTPALRDALRSNDEKLILIAMQACQNITDRNALEELKNIFWNVPIDLQRLAIAELAMHGDCSDMPFFLSVIDECDDSEVLKGVLSFLATQTSCRDIDDIVFNLLGHRHEDVQAMALEACINLHSPRLNEQFRILSREGDVMQRMMSIYALGRYDAMENIDQLSSGLEDEEASVRKMSVEAFFNMGPDSERFLPRLLPCLKDPDKDVRMATVDLLGQLATPSVMHHLLAALDDSNDWVRIRAIEALGRARYEDAIPQLSQMLENGSPMVATKVIEALGMIGGNVAFTVLLGLMNNEDPDVQHAAEEAVAAIQANQE